VVLQQVQSRTGELEERMVIDGQQRLTMLQVLLNALHAELRGIDAVVPAGRLDRPAFNEVMGAPYPVDYEILRHQKARLVESHRFFSEQAGKCLLSEGTEQIHLRAVAIERSVFQLVVIDLSVDENAQEIFETLNARGAQLTAADLIKTFVFQKLQETGANVEKAYETHWQGFETAFWETEIGRGTAPTTEIFAFH
jgi:hypothetical protein